MSDTSWIILLSVMGFRLSTVYDLHIWPSWNKILKNWRKRQKWNHVFRETLKKCRKWHILLNSATRGCPWVKFKFRHASTLGECHLGQRWRIWDPMGTHNNVFREKSTSLNPMTLDENEWSLFVCKDRLEFEFAISVWSLVSAGECEPGCKWRPALNSL